MFVIVFLSQAILLNVYCHVRTIRLISNRLLSRSLPEIHRKTSQVQKCETPVYIIIVYYSRYLRDSCECCELTSLKNVLIMFITAL